MSVYVFLIKANVASLGFLYVMGFAEEELTMPTFHFTSLHVCHVADYRKLDENYIKGWLWWNTLGTVFYKKSSIRFIGVVDTQFYACTRVIQ
jgi:hypothetical protein